MSVKINTFTKSKHLTFRINMNQYSLLKEYSAANEMSISEAISEGMNLLLNNASVYSKYKNNDEREYIYKALNDLNNKMNEILLSHKISNTSIGKKTPYFFICIDEYTAKTIISYYKSFMCRIMTKDKIEKFISDSPYNYHFVIVTESRQMESFTGSTHITLNPDDSNEEKINQIKSILELGYI